MHAVLYMALRPVLGRHLDIVGFKHTSWKAKQALAFALVAGCLKASLVAGNGNTPMGSRAAQISRLA